MYDLKSFDLHADIGYDIMQKKNKGYKENILKTYHLPKFEQGEIAYICMASFFDGHEAVSYTHLVSAGNIDSMVNHYSVNKRRRDHDRCV